MQNHEASSCFRQGMQLLHADRLDEAVDFFTMAIKLDPRYVEAYRNRGEIFNLLGRVVEANRDLQQARSIEAVAAGTSRRKVSRKVGKIDLKSVPSIYDDLLAAGAMDSGGGINFAGQVFDYVFSGDTLEPDTLLTAAQGDQSSFPAILEYLNGKREEAPIIRLFGPGKEEITLADKGRGGERVIALEQLSCIRLARVPADLARERNATCYVEVIETVDGNIYHESIHPEQGLKNVLYGFTTKQDSRFRYTLIPRTSIRKRYQQRQLGQILLDRNLIAGDVLEHALAEHGALKKVKFGRVIARHAKILYSAVEAEIQRASQANRQGMKIGEILLDAGLVTEDQIEAALAQQERLRNKRLGQFLIEKGILQERDVYASLAEKFRIPFVDLRQQKVTKTILSLLPREMILKLHVLPLALREDVLVVATMLPDPGPVCEVVHRYASARNVEFVLAQPSHLKNVIRVLFRQQGTGHRRQETA